MGSRGEYGADALVRWVGISLLAFWADCGQPRKLLRSSSGAKSRGVSQVPASSPTTSSPARASGNAATPPTAPSPMMTTSVFLRLMAMAAPFDRERHVVIGRLANRLGSHRHALVVGAHRQADAGIADEIPADEIGVATVVRITERALNGVRADEIEECCRVGRKAGGDVLLEVREHGVLVARRQLHERRALLGLRVGVERREAIRIGRA